MLKNRGANLDDRNGTIYIQDHGDPVWSKNIRLRTIPENEDIGHSQVKPAKIPDEILEQEAKHLKRIVERRKQAKKK